MLPIPQQARGLGFAMDPAPAPWGASATSHSEHRGVLVCGGASDSVCRTRVSGRRVFTTRPHGLAAMRGRFECQPPPTQQEVLGAWAAKSRAPKCTVLEPASTGATKCRCTCPMRNSESEKTAGMRSYLGREEAADFPATGQCPRPRASVSPQHGSGSSYKVQTGRTRAHDRDTTDTTT